jgi:hypothetical protein
LRRPIIARPRRCTPHKDGITVRPTSQASSATKSAQACNLEIIEDFRDEDVEEVVDMLSREQRFAGKYGVICWRHSDLPRLIASLGAPDGTYPDPWNPATFDLLVDVAYVGAGAPQVRCITPSF